MQSADNRIYIHTLIAVFGAAFELGFDPYALAAQAKMLVALQDPEDSISLVPAAEQIINESLFAAKVLRC